MRLWGPSLQKAAIHFPGKNIDLPLEKADEAYWVGSFPVVREGEFYQFRINGEKLLPDPASLAQPGGVHGPSAVQDLSFSWQDVHWKNPLLKDYMIYELHCGTFSEEGNFEGIEKKLDHLLDLGVNAIEIMPVAQFPGERNWGYDGVFPFAVQHSYGGARGLQQLVNACHQKGMAVILDVVYNHLGPEGNYLGEFGPYFTDKYKTPWGNAINFDDAWCDGVREYFIENALMWFRDFHVDALRLDAVHAIRDLSAVHILREMKMRVDELARTTGRKHYLIVESDLNDPRYIDPFDKGGYAMDAQWVDEFHHALRVTAGEKQEGYYSDFNGIGHLAKSFRDVYVYDGQFSVHRKRKFGAPTQAGGGQFIVFSQNHDQVGNRMLGERTASLVSFEMQKLLAASVIFSPYIPMLFMGEEWGEKNPFLYFVSHTDEALAEAVRKGRREEFSSFFSGEGEAPDPMSEETFLRSRLSWGERNNLLLDYYKHIIQLRKLHPCFAPGRNVEAVADEALKLLWLRRRSGQDAILVFNYSQVAAEFQWTEEGEWKCLLESSAKSWGGPGSASPVLLQKPAKILLNPESVSIYLHV